MPSDTAVLVGTLAIDDHRTWVGHPERPARLDAVDRALDDPEIRDLTAPLPRRVARHDELARAHAPGYLDALAGLAANGGGELDPDTPVSAGSWDTAAAAAGLGLSAVAALREGRADAAFVAPRPPGHHATAGRGMGFCLLNNVAVTAAALAAEGERVLVVDWDVHHGNGTQEIFWDDPRVLYASTHQWPAYPGTGAVSETGGAGAEGTTVNVPLPPGTTGDVALAAFDEVIAPASARFAPTWVLISAGFDAHRDDPLADLAWSAGDFAALTRRVAALAPARGRTIAFLEGGYDLDALRRSVTVTVAALAGVHLATEAVTNGGPGRPAVDRAVVVQHRTREDRPSR